ncbi:MAG TPA: DegT/DnrJ/EryC1/StrS family aminotransferase [Gaiellaceae bacterium]
MRVYPRHHLDLTVGHLLYAALACCRRADSDRLGRSILAHGARADGIVCFSVRSGFELLLDALQLRPGSEVVVSAITHPDMVRIIERHGLRSVAVDIDSATLAPRLDVLNEAITSRTRAILVAHLFGSRFDVGPVAETARRHGLLLLEDCAQSLRGPGDSGYPGADVAMFSFGSIKTCPALGGAIFYVRDESVRARMEASQAAWPRQPRLAYLKRVAWFAGLLVLGEPTIFGAFVRAAALFGADLEQLVNASIHAVRPPSAADEERFAIWLRHRPSIPMLALLERRFRRFDAERLRLRTQRGEELLERLPRAFTPGHAADLRTHWVFPVAVDEPEELARVLRKKGFDTTSPTSIAAIDSSDGARPVTAHDLMARVVFVPAYPELPRRARQRLVAALESHVEGNTGR